MKTETVKHSALPWKVNKNAAGEVMIQQAHGGFICFFAGLDDEGPTSANADFIVRAVNAHEELVAAASAVLKDLNGWVRCVARSNGFNHEITRLAESRRHSLRAALKKAGA